MAPALIDEPTLDITRTEDETGEESLRIDGVRDVRGLAKSSFAGPLLTVIQELNCSEDRSNDAIARIILKDADLSAILTGVARSAAYKDHGRVESVEDAVRKLGRNAVRYYTMRQTACWLGAGGGEFADLLTAHILVVGEIARELGDLRDPDFANQAHLAGLVHDFGKLVLLKNDPTIYSTLSVACRRRGLTTLEAERERLSTTFESHTDHVSLGAWFLELTNNPPAIVEAVRAHHDPWEGHVRGWNKWTLAGVVMLADLLARRAGYGDGISRRAAGQDVDPTPLLRLGRREVELDRLVGRAVARAEDSLALATSQVDHRALGQQRQILREGFRSELHEVICQGHVAEETICCALLDAIQAEPAVTWATLFTDFSAETRPRAIRALECMIEHGFVKLDDGDGHTIRAGDRLDRVHVHEILACLRADNGPARPDEPAAAPNPAWLAPDPDRVDRAFVHDDPLTDARWAPAGDRLVVRLGHRSLAVLDGETLEVVAENPDLGPGVEDCLITDIDWTCDGRHVCVAFEGGQLRILRSADLGTLPTGACYPDANIHAIACHPTEVETVALGTADGKVQAWLRAFDPGLSRSFTLGRHKSMVRCLAWSPDGNHLASGAADGSVYIWDTGDGELMDVAAGHRNAINDLVWTDDSRRLVSAGEDGAMRIWSLDDHAYELESPGHGTAFVRASLSGGGRLLAGLGRDGQVVLWDLAEQVMLTATDIELERDGFRSLGGCLDFRPGRMSLLLPGSGGRRIVLRHYLEDRVLEFLGTVGHRITQAHDSWKYATRARRDILRIIHISDLHIRARENVRLMAKRLVLDVRKVLPTRPDVVVVSGDFVNTAAKNEYHTCVEFLSRIQDGLGVPRANFVPVPGNHDVDWNAVPCRLDDEDQEKARKTGWCEHRKVCHDCNLGSAAYRARFENFARYVYERFLHRKYPLDYGRQVFVKTLPELGVRFVGHNTSWRIDGCHKDDADFNAEVLVDLELEHDDDLATIAVWHHPLNVCESGEADVPKHLLSMGTILGLHGHIHEADDNAIGLQSDDPIVVLAAGSLHASGEAMKEGTPQAYQLLELDRETRRLTVHNRCKRPVDEIWEDHSIWDTGRREVHAARREFQLRG